MAAKEAATTDSKRPKRRLRSNTETVRERQASAANVPVKKPSRFGKILRPLGWPFRKIASLSVWKAKWFKPFRVVDHWLGLILWPRYFRSSFEELKLVTWPNWHKTWRLTFAVLAFSVVFGALIAGIDFVLDKLFKEVLLK